MGLVQRAARQVRRGLQAIPTDINWLPVGAMLLALIPIFIRAIEYASPRGGASFWSAIPPAFASAVVCAASLSLWRLVRGYFRVAAPLTWTLLAATTSSLVSAVAAVVATGTKRIGHQPIPLFLVQATVLGTIALLGAAALFRSLDRYYYLRNELRFQQLELTDERALLEADLARFNQQVDHLVSTNARQELTDLDRQLQMLATQDNVTYEQVGAVAARLRIASQSIFRSAGHALRSLPAHTGVHPVEHRIPQNPRVTSDIGAKHRATPTLNARQLAHIASGDSLYPTEASLIGVVAVLLVGTHSGLSLLTVVAGALTWVIVVSLLARQRSRLSTSAVRSRLVSAIAIYAVAGLSASLALWILTFLTHDSPGDLTDWAALLLVWSIVIGLSVLTAFSVSDHMMRDRVQLQSVNQLMRWEILSFEVQTEAVRHHLGYLLHTDLQGMASNCATRLETTIPTDSRDTGEQIGEQTHQALRDSAARITAAERRFCEALEAPPNLAPTTLTDGFTTLVDAWAGVLSITVDVDQQSERIAADHTPVARLIIELAAEGINNASIHGAARNAHVHLYTEDRWITLAIDNDGLATTGDLDNFAESQRGEESAVHRELLRLDRDRIRLDIRLPRPPSE